MGRIPVYLSAMHHFVMYKLLTFLISFLFLKYIARRIAQFRMTLFVIC